MRCGILPCLSNVDRSSVQAPLLEPEEQPDGVQVDQEVEPQSDRAAQPWLDASARHARGPQRGIQPLQAQAHPMWQYTRENDPIRAIRGGFFENKSKQGMLSLMFKGEMTYFPSELFDAGFSADVIVPKVILYLSLTASANPSIQTDPLFAVIAAPLVGSHRPLPSSTTRRPSAGRLGVAPVRGPH